MSTQRLTKLNIALCVGIQAVASACGSSSAPVASTGRVVDMHQALSIVADDGTVTSTLRTSDMQVANSSSQQRSADLNTIVGSPSLNSALVIQLGSVYLESQMAPPTVSGYALQASDIGVASTNAYVGYDKVDSAAYVKVGAIDQVSPYVCDNLLTLTHVEYCLGLVKSVASPTQEIFSLASDGTNLYTVGSTLDETYSPNYGRLTKYTLDASKSITGVAATQVLPSYAGTGVDVLSGKVYTTSGTSTTTAQMGGVQAWNSSDLSNIWSNTWYDARSVVIDRNTPTNLYAINGKTDVATASSVSQITASTGAVTRNTAITGNDIAESKSSVIVGNQLVIASMGSQGFRVLCKSTGATLNTVAAVTVAGIPAARTVTNSVAAAPGFLFAADGEAGVYVYSFNRNNVFNTNLCTSGLTITAIGRLKLDSDNSDATYTNAELSANGIKTLNLLNVLNVISSRFIMVASGNKGVSLLNISDITISTTAVDDF